MENKANFKKLIVNKKGFYSGGFSSLSLNQMSKINAGALRGANEDCNNSNICLRDNTVSCYNHSECGGANLGECLSGQYK